MRGGRPPIRSERWELKLSLVEGSGSQLAASAWGSSSSPSVDLADDRTFYYTASIALNVTAVQPTALGYLTLYAGDAPQPPAVSMLNFSAGKTRGSNAVVALPLDGSGSIQVRNGSTGAVDLVLDVTGYFK
jgi:hypothetical protein